LDSAILSRLSQVSPRRTRGSCKQSNIKNVPRANIARPRADGSSASLEFKPFSLKSEISKQNVITPLKKVMSVNKKMIIWICNVRSISGKTDSSAQRKDYLINRIKENWPDAIILLETNHTSAPNILAEFYDNFYTPPSDNKGVILLTKKLLGCEQIASLEDRVIIAKSRIISDFTLMGVYCPYLDLKNSTTDFIRKFQNKFWFIGGDFENFGNQIVDNLESGFWGRIDYTREANNNRSKTEFAGFFYQEPIMTRLEKICDHFLINCEIDTCWDGVQINFPAQISRKNAICTCMNYYSQATSAILADWPKLNFASVVYGLIPVVTRSIKIYKKDISLEDISKTMAKNYKKRRNESINLALKKALISNNTKTVASITSKILNIPRKGKSSISVLGITNSEGRIFIGKDATPIIKEFYGNLFNNPSINKTKTVLEWKPIMYDESVFDTAIKKLGRKKAMSCDQFPDELLDLPYVKNKLKCEFKEILRIGIIPLYLKFGRLCLLSKEQGNVYPKIENTRPIIILSAVYKLCEIYWLIFTGDCILKKIGRYQTGFKKNCSTQYNICLLKQWLKTNKKSLVLFVDINKAYDNLIREKLYDLLSVIGIPHEFVQFYVEMTSNMKIFINDTESIEYTNGVPQGSCISPILFNLYYEEALKTINPYSDLHLAFADDAAFGLKLLSNLPIIQNNLKQWKSDLNLKVNDRKTECLLYYLTKPENLIYPICESFKYLGVKIFNNKSQFSRTFIIQQISNIAKKAKCLSFSLCPIKVKKLNVTWWFISILLYKQISNLYLNFISIPEFTKIALAKIKSLLHINKQVIICSKTAEH